ncbi:MAG: hypothetical protein ABI165_12790 [Bryobacteraceae bacterium]
MKIIAGFMRAIAISGVAGGAVTGWILEHLSDGGRGARLAVALSAGGAAVGGGRHHGHDFS